MSDYITIDGNAVFISRLMRWCGTEFHDDAEWAEREILRLLAELDYWKKDSAAAWDKCEEEVVERDKLRELLREARGWAQHYDMGDEPMLHGDLLARIDAALGDNE